MMDFDLSPTIPQKTLFDGEGGYYKSWSTSELAYAKLGGGKLFLQPRAFALPHFPDCSKIGYVLQGTDGVAGMVLPNSSKEVVVKLKKGDVIPVPIGWTSWWYNNGDSDLEIIFLGETSKSYFPGEFTYFFLSGGLGNIGGFSSEFISQAYNMNKIEAEKLTSSQKGVLIINIEKGIKMPNPDLNLLGKFVYNIDNSKADIEVLKGGIFKTLTLEKFPFLENVGLSVIKVKLEANAMFSPTYTVNGTDHRLVYVVEGNGEVQIVGFNGKRILDSKIEGGQLFLVPKFFTVAVVGGNEGMEFISISTSTCHGVEELATKRSVWTVFSPVISQISLGVTSEYEEFFKSNIERNSIIIPPTNK